MANLIRLGGVGSVLKLLNEDPSRIRMVAAVVVNDKGQVEILCSHYSIVLLGGASWLVHELASKIDSTSVEE